ncbi:MAG: YbaY family lipoprotein [Planctomycetales bacterium]|nr:YbaY family lipoprotein [Planctomycetales bacterium]
MKIFLRVALATLLYILAVGTEQCSAVDANRASSQASQAPSSVNSGANAFADPAFGWSGTTLNTGADRDRSQARVAPNWNYQPPTTSAPAQPYQPSYLPPGQSEQSQTLDRWRLGIYPEDTDTGVRIAEVVRGSAAERAGLEVNDRLISVHGFQIGYVDGALYDVGQELERHADQQGWVRLLVQNNRDGQLMNLPVRLDPRRQSLTGTITYRDRTALPRDAVATVELREVLRADLQPITIARQTITSATRVPIPFKLEFDPSEVNSSRNYVISARIESGGRQIYAMRQDLPVLGGKSPGDLQLLVESTASFPGGSAPSRNEQLTQISRWFSEYLGREPRSQELYVWEAHLARGGTLTDAQLQILSTPEFYYQANSDDTQYIYRMFQLVTQRQPSQQEVSQWLNRLNSHHRLRSELAREFLAMANSQASRSSRR